MNNKTQFTVRSVFILVTMVAIISATYSWLLTKNGFDTFSEIPPLFCPDIPMMTPGIMLVPFFCLPMALLTVAFVLRSTPRPYTAVAFFALQFAVFAIDVSYWGHGMRLISVMALASLAMITEASYRKLPTPQLLAGVASLLVTTAWYIAIVCACASGAI